MSVWEAKEELIDAENKSLFWTPGSEIACTDKSKQAGKNVRSAALFKDKIVHRKFPIEASIRYIKQKNVKKIEQKKEQMDSMLQC